MAVKYAILGLLQYKNMHGYRIKEIIERNFGYMWTINFGQIYPTLKKLQDDGFVTMEEVSQQNAPDKKLYSITDKGKKDFSEWLKSEPEKKLIMRDPFLLRFTFFGFGEKESALAMIDDQLKMYEKQLQLRKANIFRRARGDIYARLLTELGVEFNELIISWLKRAKKEISEEGKMGKTADGNR